MAASDSILDQLRVLAAESAARSHAPYSAEPAAAILLLSDGMWIPGVRVESASFSLTIPAVLNATTTAATMARKDIVACVLSRPFRLEERVFISSGVHPTLHPVAVDAFVIDEDRLPHPRVALSPFLETPGSLSIHQAVDLARKVSGRAVVPESAFRVGCVAGLADGRFVAGVNVESRDWLHILCAERNALGTTVSYGLGPIDLLYLSCASDPLGTPCGACRQLLAELAPSAKLWMDRGENPPEGSDAAALLPGFFRGERIARVR